MEYVLSPHVRVPIVKFVDGRHRLEVDMCVGQAQATAFKAAVVRHVSTVSPLFAPLFRVVSAGEAQWGGEGARGPGWRRAAGQVDKGVRHQGVCVCVGGGDGTHVPCSAAGMTSCGSCRGRTHSGIAEMCLQR